MFQYDRPQNPSAIELTTEKGSPHRPILIRPEMFERDHPDVSMHVIQNFHPPILVSVNEQ
jgi:hypothetical protein